MVGRPRNAVHIGNLALGPGNRVVRPHAEMWSESFGAIESCGAIEMGVHDLLGNLEWGAGFPMIYIS